MTKCGVKGTVPNKLHFLGWSLHWPGSPGVGVGGGGQTQGDMSPGLALRPVQAPCILLLPPCG